MHLFWFVNWRGCCRPGHLVGGLQRLFTWNLQIGVLWTIGSCMHAIINGAGKLRRGKVGECQEKDLHFFFPFSVLWLNEKRHA